VSKSKYADLNKNYDAAMTKNKELQTNVETLSKTTSSWQSEKAAIEAQAKENEATAQQLGMKLQEQQKAVEDMKSTYESLVGNLKGELDSGKLQVQQLRDGISVNLAQDILFKSGSAQLDKTGRELLLKVSDQLKASPFQIVVTGHTDNQKIGPALAARYPTNWELGGRARGAHRPPVRGRRHRLAAARRGLVRGQPSARAERHAGGTREEPAHRDPAPAGGVRAVRGRGPVTRRHVRREGPVAGSGGRAFRMGGRRIRAGSAAPPTPRGAAAPNRRQRSIKPIDERRARAIAVAQALRRRRVGRLHTDRDVR
jgi:outer membrane protein OmpA-like peptidoglycan-associated protein